MGDVVDLRGQPAPTKDDFEFVTDLARFAEAIVSEADIKRKYRLADAAWEKFGADDELVRASRCREAAPGPQWACKRERAQIEIRDGPPILGKIMRDPDANAKHKIDAVKALDALATDGRPEGAPTADRFVITINLGSDTLRFNKSIKIDANDSDPFNDVDTTNVIAANAAKKPTESGGGNTL